MSLQFESIRCVRREQNQFWNVQRECNKLPAKKRLEWKCKEIRDNHKERHKTAGLDLLSAEKEVRWCSSSNQNLNVLCWKTDFQIMSNERQSGKFRSPQYFAFALQKQVVFIGNDSHSYSDTWIQSASFVFARIDFPSCFLDEVLLFFWWKNLLRDLSCQKHDLFPLPGQQL